MQKNDIYVCVSISDSWAVWANDIKPIADYMNKHVNTIRYWLNNPDAAKKNGCIIRIADKQKSFRGSGGRF